MLGFHEGVNIPIWEIYPVKAPALLHEGFRMKVGSPQCFSGIRKVVSPCLD